MDQLRPRTGPTRVGGRPVQVISARAGARGRHVLGRRRRGPRSDWSERRGQDDAVRVPGGSAALRPGRGAVDDGPAAAASVIAALLRSRCDRAVAGAVRCAGRSISRSAFFGGRAWLRVRGRGAARPHAAAADARSAALSKGQRKRALLAIGLLTPQPVLLIDEPFDGLDLRQSRDVAAALRTHASRGRTLFLSIHQITDAARFCDRFVLLSGGRVCGEGTVTELAALAVDARRRAHADGSGRGVPCAHVGPAFLWLLEKEWRELWCRARGGCCCSRWGRWWACRSSARCAPTARSAG